MFSFSEQVLIWPIFVSVSVLFTDPKGQIEFTFLMNTSAVISLKTFTMTEAGNILQKQMQRTVSSDPLSIISSAIIIMNIFISSLLLHCLYKTIFFLWSFQNTDYLQLNKDWGGISQAPRWRVAKGSWIKSPVLIGPMQLQDQQHSCSTMWEIPLIWSKQAATFTKLHYITVHTMPPRVIQRH